MSFEFELNVHHFDRSIGIEKMIILFGILETHLDKSDVVLFLFVII